MTFLPPFSEKEVCFSPIKFLVNNFKTRTMHFKIFGILNLQQWHQERNKFASTDYCSGKHLHIQKLSVLFLPPERNKRLIFNYYKL